MNGNKKNQALLKELTRVRSLKRALEQENKKLKEELRTMKSINYYILDHIEKDDLGITWGYLNGQMFEVFYLSADDTEANLIENGFAKCDAPGWNETMVVEESAISCAGKK